MYIPSFVVLNGNVGQDPKAIQTNSGVAMATFTVAVSQGKDVPPVWCDVTCFDRTAEGVLDQVRQGDGVLVVAQMKSDTWEQDGQKRTKTKYTAHEVAIKVRGGDGGGGGQDGGSDDDDIPF